MAGKMRSTSGKSILTGAFWACSSALAFRFLRMSSARLRRIWAIETPSSSPWTIARTKARMPGRVGAARHVLQRLVGADAHALLLERQPQLVAERALELLRREPHRADEADARLDRDDEQVDQVGQLLVDLVVALLDPAREQERRQRSSRRAALPASRRRRRVSRRRRAAPTTIQRRNRRPAVSACAAKKARGVCVYRPAATRRWRDVLLAVRTLPARQRIAERRRRSGERAGPHRGVAVAAAAAAGSVKPYAPIWPSVCDVRDGGASRSRTAASSASATTAIATTMSVVDTPRPRSPRSS